MLNFNCSIQESLILLLNTLIILIEPIVLVYIFLSMEGRWNMWNPWYLLPKDKLGKVECKFCCMLFHTARKYSSSISAIDMMAMGELELQCVQRHIHG